MGYRGFRQGIDYLVKDARTFSENLASSTLSEAVTSKYEVHRLERRLGIPGRLKRLLVNLDELDFDAKTSGARQSDALVREIRREIARILEDASDPEDRDLIIRQLPTPLRPLTPHDLPDEQALVMQLPALEPSRKRIHRRRELPPLHES